MHEQRKDPRFVIPLDQKAPKVLAKDQPITQVVTEQKQVLPVEI